MILFNRFRRNSQEDEQPAHPYQSLLNLVRAYFHQDYDLVSEDPDEIIRAYHDENSPIVVHRLISDITRYLQDHSDESEQIFTTNFETLFQPEIEFEGWKDRTTRQFLMHAIELLSERK